MHVHKGAGGGGVVGRVYKQNMPLPVGGGQLRGGRAPGMQVWPMGWGGGTPKEIWHKQHGGRSSDQHMTRKAKWLVSPWVPLCHSMGHRRERLWGGHRQHSGRCCATVGTAHCRPAATPGPTYHTMRSRTWGCCSATGFHTTGNMEIHVSHSPSSPSNASQGVMRGARNGQTLPPIHHTPHTNTLHTNTHYTTHTLHTTLHTLHTWHNTPESTYYTFYTITNSAVHVAVAYTAGQVCSAT